MNRILIIIILIVNSVYLFGTETSGEVYQEKSKIYITEVIKAFMDAYKPEKNLSPQEIKGKNAFINNYYQTGKWDKTEIDSILITGWAVTRDGLFSSYYDKIATDSLSYLQLLDYQYNKLSSKNKAAFFKNLNPIQSKYKSDFLSSYDSLNVQGQELKPIIINTSGHKESTMIPLFKLGILLFFVFIIAISFFINIRQYLKIEKLEGEIQKLNSENDRNIIDTKTKKQDSARKPDSENKSTLKASSQNGNQLDKEKHIQSKTIDVNNTDLDDPRFSIKTADNNTEREKKQQFESHTYFFDTFEKGSFLVENAKINKGSWDIYKITTKDDKVGELELIIENPKEILSNKDVYLKKEICSVHYESGGNRSVILTSNPGAVILKDKKWIVDKKIGVIIK